jgi:hypothetical protein
VVSQSSFPLAGSRRRSFATRKRKPDETSLDRYYRQLSLIKGDVWQRENEWRLMWRSKTETGDVYKISITPKCVRAVYLGLNIPGDDARRIKDAIARHFPNADVWQASKRHGNLCLDFQRTAPGKLS